MKLSAVRRRTVVVAVAALTTLTVALSATPATAGSMFFSKSSGRTASADWLEVGTLPGGVPGNIHFGFMQVEDLGGGRANVFGVVDDLTCPNGVIPGGPGGGHGEPVESECTYEGARFIDGGDVTFTMDRKFRSASLTGTLAVFGHDGPAGNPGVAMTWTGVGNTFRSVESGRYDDGTNSGSYRYSFTGRDAGVSGNIGAMVFDDEVGEYSNAQMGSYRSVSRDRQR